MRCCPIRRAVALGASILALGLTNGSNAGQAIVGGDDQPAPRGRASRAWRCSCTRSAARRPQIVAFLINAAKGTPIASFIGAPELLSALTDITLLLQRPGDDLLPAADLLHGRGDDRGLAVRQAARLARRPARCRHEARRHLGRLRAVVAGRHGRSISRSSIIALLLGLVVGMPLAALRFYGGRRRRRRRRHRRSSLMRAAPTFVVMFFLLNVRARREPVRHEAHACRAS